MELKGFSGRFRDRYVAVRGWLLGICRDIPVLGGLVDCKLVDHAAASKEIVIGLIFATVTFWLSAVLIFFQGKTKGQGVMDAVTGSFAPTINNGELFVFAVSLLGPYVYIAFEEPAWAHREFPQKLWHAATLIILTILCGALYSAVKTGAPFDKELVIAASLWFAGAAVVLRYLASVFNKARSRPNEELRAQTEGFIGQFDRHRDEEPKT